VLLPQLYAQRVSVRHRAHVLAPALAQQLLLERDL